MRIILDPYGGVKAFAAAASDSTQSFLNMRNMISPANPVIVSLKYSESHHRLAHRGQVQELLHFSFVAETGQHVQLCTESSVLSHSFS